MPKGMKGKQGRKDNSSARINLDNERETKFKRDFRPVKSKNKSNSKPRDRKEQEESEIKRQMNRLDSNDINWYTRNPGLSIAAGRIPFASIVGDQTPMKLSDVPVSIPQVMALEFSPNFAPDGGTIMNQCAQSYYSDVVHANSRNQSYEPADLMLVTIAGHQAFALIAAGIRALGVMRAFEESTLMESNVLLKALGFDSADLRSNYSHMAFDINYRIAQSRQIWVPNDMPILQRWFWMNTTIYSDADAVRSQYYLYRQRYFYKYTWTNSTGTSLTAVEMARDLKWADYLTLLDSLLEALISVQDRGTMYGDILKAYGPERIFVLNEVDINYRTVVSYNPEVLWQIENATRAGNIHVSEVYQQPELGTTQLIKQKYAYNGSLPTTRPLTDYIPEIGLINFHQKMDPTPEQLLVATRMMALGNTRVLGPGGGSSDEILIPTVCGTEMISDVYIYYIWYNTTGTGANIERHQLTMMLADSAGMPANQMFRYMSFDWQPAIHSAKLSATEYITGATIYKKVTGELAFSEYANYTFISLSELRMLHNAVLMSLYAMPRL